MTPDPKDIHFIHLPCLQVHMTGSVLLASPAILAAIASVALKSLLESIRLEVRRGFA